jgi:hypothetical protein
MSVGFSQSKIRLSGWSTVSSCTCVTNQYALSTFRKETKTNKMPRENRRIGAYRVKLL